MLVNHIREINYTGVSENESAKHVYILKFECLAVIGQVKSIKKLAKTQGGLLSQSSESSEQ